MCVSVCICVGVDVLSKVQLDMRDIFGFFFLAFLWQAKHFEYQIKYLAHAVLMFY